MVPIQALLDRLGVEGSAEQFVPLVSNLYHEAESGHYDQVHQELDDAAVAWRACLDAIGPNLPHRLRVLDIGAGTGFASVQVWRALGSRIDRLVCLDPSAAMLAKARSRLAGATGAVRFVVGDLGCLDQTRARFDLVVTNSVLHHVPDVPQMLRRIQTLLNDGGFYLAGHEPCREFFANPELQRWTAAYRRWRAARRLVTPRTYLRRLRPAARGVSVVEATSAALLARGVIARPLSSDELRSLIDIHVPSADAATPGWALFGLDRDEMLAAGLAGCDSRFATSYSHIKDARARMGPGWRAIDRWLGRRFPTCGANFLLAVQRQPTGATRGSTVPPPQPCT